MGVRSAQWGGHPLHGNLRAQIDACFDDFRIGAVKLGMLATAEVIHAVADALEAHRPPHVVVDPVMVATSGAKLLADDALVSGDTVFINGCGRCDFPGGNPEAMYRSLSQVLLKVPDSARLFPGHDYADVPVAGMDAVRQKNPYFAFPDMASFVAFRMRPRK